MTRQFWANLALCLFLSAVVIFSVIKAGTALTPKGLFVNDPVPSNVVKKFLKNVELTGFQIGETGKNIVEADFSIQNKSDRNIKNVSVLCDFFDEDGDYRDRQKWVLAETIPAMHELKISTVSKRFVNSGARAMSCTISDFKLVKKPVFTLERHMSEAPGKTSASGHGEEPSAAH